VLGQRGKKLGHIGPVVAALAVCLGGSLPTASAQTPEFLTRMPASGQPGSGAGENDNPRAIAANASTGHIYVTDAENARIDEYTAWGLFVKAWGWGVQDGSAELQTCGPAQPEEAPDPALCQRGIEGSGEGQLSRPNGIALDAVGNVYVVDRANFRVQKFSPGGDFLLMFGGDVNQTKVGEGAPANERNRCPVDPGDVCQAGTPGEEASYLAGTVGNYIAYTPADGGAIVVGDKDRIQIFDLDGTYREEITFTGPLAAFAGMSVNALDVDAAGNIYFSLAGLEDIYKIDPAGVPLPPGQPGASKFDVKVPLAVAVDHKGNVYAIDDDPTPAIMPEVIVAKFDPAGNKLVPTKAEEESEEAFPYVPFQGPSLLGIATNICAGSHEPGSLYVSAFEAGSDSYVDAFGSGPVGCEDPPLRPPLISAQYATSVGTESAKVRAEINPRFWSDATYYVEYGESACIGGGCTSKAPVPAALLSDQSANKALKTAGISLLGLRPSTTYHYRFVAQSSGGGPVFGVDPDGEGPEEASLEAGIGGSFRTLNLPAGADVCPNDAFRVGPGARLPDCRAYEMVSPLDKLGGDVALWRGKNAAPPAAFERHQVAPSGERFTYSSAYPFADPESAPWVSQYLGERTSTGWSSESISPPRSEIPIQVDNFGPEYQAFSEDLCTAWLRNNSVTPLAPKAVVGFPNLYRRANCTTPPTYTTLSTEEPRFRSPDKYVRLVVVGTSADGTHAAYTANDKLTEDAPKLPGEFEQLLYEHTPEGKTRFVCILPSGKPIKEACGAGTTTASTRNAVSADGARIFWTAYPGTPSFGDVLGTPGQLFVRIDGTETRKVSTAVALDPAWYWTAADDGSKVIFSFDSGSHKDELYEFDVDAQKASLIAKGAEGPMGASEDASRLYFASTEDLDGGGPGAKGAHNLYFYEAGGAGGPATYTFVMALAAEDIGGTVGGPAPIEEASLHRSAGVTPDGLHTTFTAVAPPPSGYDNRSAESGESAAEVYRYDAPTGDLRCISCNPSEARPLTDGTGSDVQAARIQGWEIRGRGPRVITDDGSRVFFESFEALVPRDTNGTWDVYQWEEPGKGSCDKADPTYGEEAGGCVELISSGESPAKSTFLDADPSGENIFFSTQSSLIGQDYGLNDVYVARVGGGFPEPQPAPICEGDACQGPSAAPVPPTPSSSTYRGPEAVKAKRCPKGKRRVKRAGKVRCAKKRRKGAKARKRAAAKRRASR
jgi:DNA-binding beta-propeller fold protein YncE